MDHLVAWYTALYSPTQYTELHVESVKCKHTIRRMMITLGKNTYQGTMY